MSSLDDPAFAEGSSVTAAAESSGREPSAELTPDKASFRPPTETLYTELSAAYRFFNERLFDDKLPECIISLQRTRGRYATFSPNRFVDKTTADHYAHELSLHPGYFAILTPKDLLAALVHEMVHLYTVVEKPENPALTRGYHDLDWATRMEEVGLVPSDTGEVGGKRVGFRMYHYIDPGNKFDLISDELLSSGWAMTWIDRVHERADEGSQDTPAKTKAAGPKWEAELPVVQASPSPDDTTGNDDDGSTSDQAESEKPASANLPLSAMSAERPAATKVERSPELVAANQPPSASLVGVVSERKKTARGIRLKYVCEKCEINVRGKPELHLICGICMTRMLVQDGSQSSDYSEGDD